MSVSKVFMVFVFLRFYDFLTTLLKNFRGFAEESAISNKTISLGQQRVWRFKTVIEFSDDGMSYNIFVSTLHLNRLLWNRFSWKASKILNTFDKALFLMRLETSQIFFNNFAATIGTLSFKIQVQFLLKNTPQRLRLVFPWIPPKVKFILKIAFEFQLWSRLISPEAVAPKRSQKKVFLQISQNSPEKACARVSFLIKLISVTVTGACFLPTYWKFESKLSRKNHEVFIKINKLLLLKETLSFCRSSHQSSSIKKVFLEISQIHWKIHLKFLRRPFLRNTSGRKLLFLPTYSKFEKKSLNIYYYDIL